ncbi:WG repeat-containing protein [Chitinophaga filiformis]|uniref:WG containing repeat-containing protein n=1 Tax=Chitinophaga filiformis TaxID=104663 RepID=A0A1G8B1C3_CHIFI|nr:WG repeat-containing protein [Chitinophaga filiformis]SDH27059.1 WG containing repeat-containing protein [Chitinophaga filiformis]
MKTIFFLPVLLISLWCNAQDGLYPYAEKNKWGLTNKKHAVVMEPQFDSIHLFEGEYARVENNKKVGVIHSSGRIVYPCSYSDIPFISPNGMAIAKVQKGYILLDPSTGKQKGTLLFDLPGMTPMSKTANLLLAKKEGAVGIVNMATGEPVSKKFPYDDAEFFDEKSLKDFVIVNISDKYGVVEALTGREIIPATYSEIKGASDGTQDLIKATTDDERVVYFDVKGKQVSAAVAKAAKKVEDDMDKTSTEGGLKDDTKKDLHLYKLANEKWRITLEERIFQQPKVLDSTDINGYTTLEYMSYRANLAKYPGKIKAVKNGKAGVIDMKGNVLIPLIYDDVTYREDNIGHYAFVETKVGNRVGVIPAESMKELKKPVLARVIDEDVNRQALLVQIASGTRGYMDKITGEVYIPGYKE